MLKGTLFTHYKVHLDRETLYDYASWNPTGMHQDLEATAVSPGLITLVAECLSGISHPIMFDIGAASGSFSLLTEVVNDLSVFALEPEEQKFNLLEKNLLLNNLSRARARAYRLAATDKNAVSLMDFQVAAAPTQTPELQSQLVEGIQLDTFFSRYQVPRVDFLKIRVDGFTPAVLVGAKRLLKEFRPTLLFEANPMKLALHGFQQSQIFNILQRFEYNVAEVELGEFLATSRSEGKILRILDKGYRSITPTIFDKVVSQTLNEARMAHLGSLNLPLEGKKVLEVGGGVGLLSGFFEKKGGDILSTDAREDNLAEQHRRFPFRKLSKIDLTDAESLEKLPIADVVFCYGTLYHLSNPELALRMMARSCRETFLLETAVHPSDQGANNIAAENPEEKDQAADGTGCRPSRTWILNILRELYPYVYVSVTQPFHTNFPLKFPSDSFGFELVRAIFVGSHQLLDRPELVSSLPEENRYQPESGPLLEDCLKFELTLQPHSSYQSLIHIQNAQALSWLARIYSIQSVFCPLTCELPMMKALLTNRKILKLYLIESDEARSRWEQLSSEEKSRVHFLPARCQESPIPHVNFSAESLIYISDRRPDQTLTFDSMLEELILRHQPKYIAVDHFFLTSAPVSAKFIEVYYHRKIAPLFRAPLEEALGWNALYDVQLPDEKRQSAQVPRILIGRENELRVLAPILDQLYIPLYRENTTFLFLCRNGIEMKPKNDLAK